MNFFEVFFYNEITGYIFSAITAFLILTGTCFWILIIWRWIKDNAEIKKMKKG